METGRFVRLLGLTLMLAAATSGRATDLEITWTSIDGGGVMRSTGGDLALSGTIGQCDAGLMSGDDLTLTGGFWFPVVTGDFNNDGGVNLLDYDTMEDCLLGPTGGLGETCEGYDVDGTGHVDLRDFAGFQRSFTGGF